MATESRLCLWLDVGNACLSMSIECVTHGL
jgi:hypothetical protein